MVDKKTTKKVEKTTERAKVEDIEAIVVDLGKKGNSPAKIGLILKEKYGVGKIKVLGKKIAKILKENNIEYDDDLSFVNKKLNKIEEHYKKNKQDKRAKREVVRFVGLRKKLEKYNEKNKA
jgi:ribosomal protein S15P/S13E